ncbi:MAG: sensor histidine kinase [Crocinitomicaceae bacterium]
MKGSLFILFLCVYQLYSQDLIPNKVLSDRNGLLGNACRTMVQDESGKLWFGTTSGIQYYDGETIKSFEPTIGETVIKLIKREDFIIALTVKSLFKINTLDKKFKKIDLPVTDYHKNVQSDTHIQLITNEDDTLWYDYDLQSINAKPLEFNFPKITMGKYRISIEYKYYITLDSDTIEKGESFSSDVKKLNDSLVIIGTHNGLVIIELKNGLITTKRFIKGLRTDCIFVDRDKNVWVGTADNGIYFFHKNNYLNYFKSVVQGQKKLNCWTVFTIDSTIYFASKQGILRLDGKDDELTIGTKTIRSISALYHQNSLYIGTATNGIFKYSNGGLKQIYFNPNLVLDNTVMQIFNKADTLVCISKQHIIFLKDDQIIKTLSFPELGTKPYAMYINKTPKNYWLSTTTGVTKCDLNFKTLNHYRSKTSKVICMGEFSGNEPVFASMDGGLQHIKNDSLVPYNPSENNYLFCTSYDSINNSYWTSSGEGIYYSNDQKQFMFNHENGLPMTIFNQSGYLKLKDEIIFAGSGGVFKFNPNHLLNTPTLPSVEVKINNVFPKEKEIEFEYDQGSILLELTPILLSDKNVFDLAYFIGNEKYQLASSKQFNIKLNYGTTIFKYVVKNKLTNELNKITYTFVRSTPVWMKFWFKVLIGLLAILLLTGFYFFIKYISTRKKLKTQEQQSKIDHERLRISRELHDNIGARLSYIISSIDMEQHNKNADYKNLESINSFARSTMAELRETIWAVGNKKVNLSELAHRIDLYCKEVNEFSEIDIEANSSISGDKELKPIETINFYRITQEAINNAIKYSAAKKISVVMTDHYISISDNGKGFNLAKKPHGNGLVNMKIRADECNANLDIISDLKKGTHIRITF